VAATTYGSTQTTTAAPPRVNLLPPEIAERAKLRRAQVAMVATGLAAVAVVGVMYMQATAKVSAAEDEKTQALAANSVLQQQLGDLEGVKRAYAEVDAASKTLALAMHHDVRWSSYLHDLSLTLPENVWLDELSVEMAAGSSSGGTSSNGDSVLDPGLGTVTFKGQAFSHDDVASFLDTLSKQKGYSDPYFSKAEDLLLERVIIEFEATSYLNEKALSNRYAKGLTR